MHRNITVTQIAEELGVNVSTVRRLRQKLKLGEMINSRLCLLTPGEAAKIKSRIPGRPGPVPKKSEKFTEPA